MSIDPQGAFLVCFWVQSILTNHIRDAQLYYPLLMKFRGKVGEGLTIAFIFRDDGALVIDTKLYVPAYKGLKKAILHVAYRLIVNQE